MIKIKTCTSGRWLPCVGALQADVAVSPEASAAPRTSDWTSALGPLLGRWTHLAVAFGWERRRGLRGGAGRQRGAGSAPRAASLWKQHWQGSSSWGRGTGVGAGRRCLTHPLPLDEPGSSPEARPCVSRGRGQPWEASPLPRRPPMGTGLEPTGTGLEPTGSAVWSPARRPPAVQRL